jgi:two-component system chemotaxis response regulator CheB
MEPQKSEGEIIDFGQPTTFTCPECHGVLMSLREGGRMRFRCHTGHAFSADTLLASISISIEDSLWNAVRSVQESVMFLNHMGDHFAEINQPKLAAMYFRKAREADRRAALVRKAAANHEQLSIDGIAEEARRPADESSKQE